MDKTEKAHRREALEVFAQGRPLLQPLVAFLIYLRSPEQGIDQAFNLAARFCDRTSKELQDGLNG